jgi:hypothetical protein
MRGALNPGISTIIYIHDLLDLIESVYHIIVAEQAKGNIEAALENGLDELNTRYTMVYA